MTPNYFDIHTHVHFEAFKEDADAVIKRALAAGVWSMQVGTQKDTSASAVSFSERYPEGVYATVGLHPCHTERSYHDTAELPSEYRGETFDKKYYRTLAKHPNVLAIGECGLDYYRLGPETKGKQMEAFISQIELANELEKPLMLHIRPSRSSEDAYCDALDILQRTARVGGNVHFFVGSIEIARAFFAIGFTISFTGVITFARDYDEVVKNTPLAMMMSETDAPYIAPMPFRGKRNEPIHVQEVVKKIAAIKNEDLEKVSAQLVMNAKRVFGISYE